MPYTSNASEYHSYQPFIQPRDYSPPSTRPIPPPPQPSVSFNELPPGMSPTPPFSNYKIPALKLHSAATKKNSPQPPYYPPPSTQPPSTQPPSSQPPSSQLAFSQPPQSINPHPFIPPPSLPPPPMSLPPPLPSSSSTQLQQQQQGQRPLSPTRRQASPSRYRTGRNDIPVTSNLSPNKSLRRGPPSPSPSQQSQQLPKSPQRTAKGRIDSNQMPRPKPNKASFPLPTFHSKSSTKGGRKLPPSYLTEFTAVDCGNCSPRYMRATTTAPPSTPQLKNELLLPFALTVTPFATPENKEMEVPLVDMLEYGNDSSNPIRCIRCLGYMNPYVEWIENGNKWKCNLCNAVNVTPSWYSLSSHLCSLLL
jgi:hypothetical protein